MKKILLICILLHVAILSGCGQTGALYLAPSSEHEADRFLIKK